MAHRDLGQFYLSVGDYTGALKHFTKIRESCTTSQHVVDMCIAILEVKSFLARFSVHTVLTKADLASHATRQLLSHLDICLQSRHRARRCVKRRINNYHSSCSRLRASQENSGKSKMADKTRLCKRPCSSWARKLREGSESLPEAGIGQGTKRLGREGMTPFPVYL